ncbi:hypothetical protein E2C01_048275 [Portunus trituberculatus]|uniref:Uncharacterized protein n=1 Tax=Portunus trituberculatus TaxID=210409 RepID=A0A5B7GCW1_PORTR|nr:hypothetical protein [Portunus trituberculatus]
MWRRGRGGVGRGGTELGSGDKRASLSQRESFLFFPAECYLTRKYHPPLVTGLAMTTLAHIPASHLTEATSYEARVRPKYKSKLRDVHCRARAGRVLWEEN